MPAFTQSVGLTLAYVGTSMTVTFTYSNYDADAVTFSSRMGTTGNWLDGLIRTAGRPVKVLNLFGYTGLATLVAAAAGA